MAFSSNHKENWRNSHQLYLLIFIIIRVQLVEGWKESGLSMLKQWENTQKRVGWARGYARDEKEVLAKQLGQSWYCIRWLHCGLLSVLIFLFMKVKHAQRECVEWIVIPGRKVLTTILPKKDKWSLVLMHLLIYLHQSINQYVWVGVCGETVVY